jgi:hypothetical protein
VHICKLTLPVSTQVSPTRNHSEIMTHCTRVKQLPMPRHNHLNPDTCSSHISQSPGIHEMASVNDTVFQNRQTKHARYVASVIQHGDTVNRTVHIPCRKQDSPHSANKRWSLTATVSLPSSEILHPDVTKLTRG